MRKKLLTAILATAALALPASANKHFGDIVRFDLIKHQQLPCLTEGACFTNTYRGNLGEYTVIVKEKMWLDINFINGVDTKIYLTANDKETSPQRYFIHDDTMTWRNTSQEDHVQDLGIEKELNNWETSCGYSSKEPSTSPCTQKQIDEINTIAGVVLEKIHSPNYRFYKKHQ